MVLKSRIIPGISVAHRPSKAAGKDTGTCQLMNDAFFKMRKKVIGKGFLFFNGK